jgi:uncharacterized membrane protein YhaH (DUF805 family)
MGALEVLIWILAAIGGLVLLSAIAFLTLLVWIASVGFRRMRDDDTTQLPERTDR